MNTGNATVTGIELHKLPGYNYAVVTVRHSDGTESRHEMTGSSALWAWESLHVGQTLTVG